MLPSKILIHENILTKCWAYKPEVSGFIFFHTNLHWLAKFFSFLSVSGVGGGGSRVFSVTAQKVLFSIHEYSFFLV